MGKFIYQDEPGRFKPEAIMDALIAAGIPAYIQGAEDGSMVIIETPPDIPQSVVDVIIAAHNPADLSLAELIEKEQIAAQSALDLVNAASLQTQIAGAADVAQLREAVLGLAEVVANLVVTDR